MQRESLADGKGRDIDGNGNNRGHCQNVAAAGTHIAAGSAARMMTVIPVRSVVSLRNFRMTSEQGQPDHHRNASSG